MIVYETEEVIKYLKKRQIQKPYLQARKYFELGHTRSIDLKALQPKKQKLFQFRITKKYRAIGYYKAEGFLVIKISDHQ